MTNLIACIVCENLVDFCLMHEFNHQNFFCKKCIENFDAIRTSSGEVFKKNLDGINKFEFDIEETTRQPFIKVFKNNYLYAIFPCEEIIDFN